MFESITDFANLFLYIKEISTKNTILQKYDESFNKYLIMYLRNLKKTSKKIT